VSEVPSLSLAQAILRTIVQHTGRPVNGVDVSAFPMAPGPVVGGIA
jgi:hypothetical protein